MNLVIDAFGFIFWVVSSRFSHVAIFVVILGGITNVESYKEKETHKRKRR